MWLTIVLSARLACAPYVANLPESIRADRTEVCANLALRAIGHGLPVSIVLSVAKVESLYDENALGSRKECGLIQTSHWWLKKEFAHLHNNDCVKGGFIALDLLSRCSVINWKDMTCLRERKTRDWTTALCHYNGGNRGCNGKARFYAQKVLALARVSPRANYN